MDLRHDLVARTRNRLNELLEPYLALSDSDDQRLEQVLSSVHFRLVHVDELISKTELTLFATAQNLEMIEVFAMREVLKAVATKRLMSARLAELFAFYRGDHSEMLRVDEDRIETKSRVELNNHWLEIVAHYPFHAVP